MAPAVPHLVLSFFNTSTSFCSLCCTETQTIVASSFILASDFFSVAPFHFAKKSLDMTLRYILILGIAR